MNRPDTNRVAARRTAAGFTMLELMLAVTILSLVFMAVYGIWSTALIAWKRGSGTMDIFQRQRIVLQTLSELTQSAVLLRTPQNLYSIAGDHGTDGDSVSFVTGSDVLLPPSEMLLSGLRRVTLSMQRDEYGRPFLALQNSPALEAGDSTVEPPVHVLSADVSGFAVRYRHPRDGDWKDVWQEDMLMPLALEFTVAFGGLDGRSQPTIVTRAVEMPAGQNAMMLMGEIGGRQNTTNQVGRRDIHTADPFAGGDLPPAGRSSHKSGGKPLGGRNR